MVLPKPNSDVFLAPMAEVTDIAFRILCRRYGAGLACTEMVSANALSKMNKATLQLIKTSPEEKPRWIQLFGQNIDCLVSSAKYLENKCEIIDLNFGCPHSKIIKQGSGSALLARPAKIKEIVSSLTAAVSIPITCKLRLGINSKSINILKTAKICEEANASMITIHARTQKQGYTGKADWSWIKKAKDSISIQITGNGDVKTVEDYARMKKETGCDYVMVGRAAIGNPYIFRQISDFNKTGKYSIQDNKQKINDFFSYLELAEKFNVPFRNILFHAQSFTKGMRNSSRLRLKLSKAKTKEDISCLLKDFSSNL